MATREEIRERIGAILQDGVIHDTPFSENADQILSYLHSQGVVIKVERELPKVETFCQLARVECIPKLTVQQNMLKAGYVAVEPLIGEK